MAERGFNVLGVDVSPLAVEKARAKMEARRLPCRFEALDFLAGTPPDGAFQFVFDRGCFHVFDEPDERQRFATRVAATLAPGGLWLSLIGSTEGPAYDAGPPRRSAVEVILAIEPVLEVVELRSAEFHDHHAKVGAVCRANARYRRSLRVGGIESWSEPACRSRRVLNCQYSHGKSQSLP
jgi:SAM-dependent methyltransferase